MPEKTVSENAGAIAEILAAQKANPVALTTVAGTADVTYSANEQTMLDDLQTQTNLIIQMLKDQGVAV